MPKENPFEIPEDVDQGIDDHAKGKPKKNWKMTIVLFAMAGLAVVIYFLPNDMKKEIKAAPPETVNPQQTSAMLTKKIAGDAGEREGASAEKTSKSDTPIMPGTAIENGSLTTPPIRGTDQKPNPLNPNGRQDEAPIKSYVPQAPSAGGRLSPEEEREKRREDVWASAIDAKGVKLKKIPQENAAGANPLNPYDAITQALTGASGGGASPAMQAAASNQNYARSAISTLSDPSAQAAQIAALTQPQNTQNQAPTKASQDSSWLNTAGSINQMPSPLIEHAAPAGPILQQGTIVRGALMSGINTDLPGSINARVVSDVYDSINQSVLLIPKGSRLVGMYNHDIVVGQERVLVAFTRLIRPDGSSIQLAGAPGTDMQGVAGLSGEVNNHFFKMFGSAAIIGAASALSGGQSVTVNQGLTGTQTGGTVMARALSDSVNILMQRNKNISPTITKNSGEEFMFMVTRDMLMSPAKTR